MPAGSTYSTVATTTLGSATSTVTFSSISGSYTDLVVVINAGNSQNAEYDLYVQFNSGGGAIYSRTILQGNGTTASSGRQSNASNLPLGSLMNNSPTSMFVVNIMNYSNTTTFKTILDRAANTGYAWATVGLWRNTAAINRLDFTIQNGYNFVAGSTFTLYGIQAA